MKVGVELAFTAANDAGGVAGRRLRLVVLDDGLEGIHGLDLGIGVPLAFGPSEHQASHKVWGTVLDGGGVYHNLDLE